MTKKPTKKGRYYSVHYTKHMLEWLRRSDRTKAHAEMMDAIATRLEGVTKAVEERNDELSELQIMLKKYVHQATVYEPALQAIMSITHPKDPVTPEVLRHLMASVNACAWNALHNAGKKDGA